MIRIVRMKRITLRRRVSLNKLVEEAIRSIDNDELHELKQYFRRK